MEYDVIGIRQPDLPLNLNPILEFPTTTVLTTPNFIYRSNQISEPYVPIVIKEDAPLPPQTIYPQPNDPSQRILPSYPAPEFMPFMPMSGPPQPELVGIMPLTTYSGNHAIYLSSGELEAYLPLAGGMMEGELNMGTNPLTNLPEPINPSDAATKSYVDTAVGDYLPLAGGTMNSNAVIDMNGGEVDNVVKVSSGGALLIDAIGNVNINTLFGTVNIQGDDLNLSLVNPTGLLRGNAYLDIISDDNIRIQANGIIDISGSILVRSNIDMSGNLIRNLANPVLPNDAVNLAYLGTITSAYLPLAGGTLTGVLDMSGNTISNVPLPLNDDEAVNKLYVDTAAGAYLPLTGGTLTGNLDLSGNDLLDVGSLTAGGVTENATFGAALSPMLSHNVYATNVSINSYNPITSMMLQGAGGITLNALDDININAPDVNITCTGGTDIMNITAIGGIVLGAGAALDLTAGGALLIDAGGTIQIVSTGNISIGSGNVLGADTEVEKFSFNDNEMYRNGSADLIMKDISTIEGTEGKFDFKNSIYTSTGNFNVDMSGATMIVDGSLKPTTILDTTNAFGAAGQLLTAGNGLGQIVWANPPVIPVVPASLGIFDYVIAGTIALTPALKGITYMFTTGSTLQNFTTAGLGIGDNGWFCYMKNLSSLNISVQENGAVIAGNPTLFAATITTNASICVAYWDGAILKLG